MIYQSVWAIKVIDDVTGTGRSNPQMEGRERKRDNAKKERNESYLEGHRIFGNVRYIALAVSFSSSRGKNKGIKFIDNFSIVAGIKAR